MVETARTEENLTTSQRELLIEFARWIAREQKARSGHSDGSSAIIVWTDLCERLVDQFLQEERRGMS